MNDNNFDRRNRKQRDTSPTVVAHVPDSGYDVLVYRGLDAKTNRAVFHWKLARRNRAGDGYYATYRVDGIGGVKDVIRSVYFVCRKMALVEELDVDIRSELHEFAQRLGAMIVEVANGNSTNGSAKPNEQKPNGLTSAFGTA